MGRLYDRVSDVTTSSGTGTVNLAGAAPSGYQPFSNAAISGDSIEYLLIDGTMWEQGYGTLTSGSPWTLTRNLRSASSGALVSLSGGSTQVWIVAGAQSGNPPRVSADLSSSTITPNLDVSDVFSAIKLAGAVTIANPAGAMIDETVYEVVLADNGTARAISWGSKYTATTVALPTTTVAGAPTSAGGITASQAYVVTSAGTTPFTAIGAAVNSAGTIFTATGASSGTGMAAVFTPLRTSFQVESATQMLRCIGVA